MMTLSKVALGLSTLSGFARTGIFHEAMGITVREQGVFPPAEPTLEERILRAKLLLEETVETITKGLGLAIASKDMVSWHADNFTIVAQPFGRPYDPIETLDGLADVKVIANGTAVAFGLPMVSADLAVFESNMSKLDENGKPVVNGITEGYRCLSPENKDEPGFDHTKPVGKILKASGYRPAMIGPLLGFTEDNCPGHTAHDELKNVCRYCGITSQSLA